MKIPSLLTVDDRKKKYFDSRVIPGSFTKIPFTLKTSAVFLMMLCANAKGIAAEGHFYLIDADQGNQADQVKEIQLSSVDSIASEDFPEKYAFSYKLKNDRRDIACVKVSSSDALSASKNEKVSPYTLFGDRLGKDFNFSSNTDFKSRTLTLSAEAYSDSKCQDQDKLLFKDISYLLLGEVEPPVEPSAEQPVGLLDR